MIILNETLPTAAMGIANKIPKNPNQSPKQRTERITKDGCKPENLPMILGVMNNPSKH